MTRRDYELLANSFRRTVMMESMDKNKIRRQAKLKALHLIACDIAGSIYGGNKAFDIDRFLKDCGVENV